MIALQDLNVKIFADGADKASMLGLYRNPLIKGLTTNPTLMRKAGISDYESFARDILETVTDKPISFEVFADEFADMRRQALKMRNWQDNVYVKIPILSPRGESAADLIHSLAQDGVKLNVTAILTERQIIDVAVALAPSVPSVVSIFAGRIADTGRDPMPIVRFATQALDAQPLAETLWASVREVLNIFQSEQAGAGIVTVPHDVLKKAIELNGRDLSQLSLETVQMFDRDAKAAGYTLDVEQPVILMPSASAVQIAA